MMNYCKKIVVTIGCLGVMIGAAGCASNDVVKKDDALAGTEATSKAAAVPAGDTAATALQKNEVKPAASVEPARQASDQSAKTAASQGGFDKIYFDFDNADLSKVSRDTLTRSAEMLLKSRKDASLHIEGHCDERGSAEYNLALGERRAKAAATYLSTLGVKADRISTLSYGKERPAVQGNDEAVWSKNRRDELLVRN